MLTWITATAVVLNGSTFQPCVPTLVKPIYIKPESPERKFNEVMVEALKQDLAEKVLRGRFDD